MWKKTIFSIIISAVLPVALSFAQSQKIPFQLDTVSHFVGVALYDPLTNDHLVQYNQDKLFIPASNLKLLTAMLFLSLNQDSIHGMLYKNLGDSTYIKGQGDPTFLHPHFSHQPVFDSLKKSKTIIICNDNQPTPYAPGWSWDDYTYDYQPERSAMPTFGNQVWLTKGITGFDVFPSMFKDVFEMGTDTTETDWMINREQHRNYFRAINVNKVEEKDFPISSPYIVSPDLQAKMLSDTLHVMVDTATCKISQWDTIMSYPVDTLLTQMLHESDNLFAEQLLWMASNTLKTDLPDSKWLTGQYNIDRMKWVDGSGLSRYNLASPHQMINILDEIYDLVPTDRFKHLLPTPGQGTFEDEYPKLRKIIYAKSGSMGGVYNLSGLIITKSNRMLLFSIMNNNFVAKRKSIMDMTQSILLEIYNRY